MQSGRIHRLFLSHNQWCSYSSQVIILICYCPDIKVTADPVSRMDAHLVTGEGSNDGQTYLLACFPWQLNSGPELGTAYVTLE